MMVFFYTGEPDWTLNWSCVIDVLHKVTGWMKEEETFMIYNEHFEGLNLK